MVHAFLKDISSKGNIIAKVEFEHTIKSQSSILASMLQGLSFQVRVDLEVIAMKEYSELLKSPKLAPHY